jgi:poly-beta-1,6-N-acetyl-D-glucosamine synthase
MTMTYAVVTPVRNEADNLRRLGACFAAQTVLPAEWIIVDNGSTDDTLAVIAELARERPWIRLLTIEGGPVAARGGPIVRALRAGFDALGEPVDVVFKVDADVSMNPDYVERLLGEFAADQRLGIASGSLYEQNAAGDWEQRFGTRDLAWGAFRSYRRDCLAALFPLPERQGWDEVDAITASLHGYRTATILDVPFWHHRREGDRDGGFAAWRDQGDVAYFLHYRPLYLLLRTLYRARRRPIALAMLWGYARAGLRGTPRLDAPEVVAVMRDHQRLRSVPRAAREARGWTRRPSSSSTRPA